MYVMPDSTASGMTPEPAQLDFSHGLLDFCFVAFRSALRMYLFLMVYWWLAALDFQIPVRRI
jgi:hypothetical protein